MSKDGKLKNTGLLSCLVILALLVAVISFGTVVYKGVLGSRDASNDLRSSMSYLRNQVKNHDMAGCVEIREDGSILVLKEPDGEYTYEIRIYVYDGMLSEEYSMSGFSMNPDGAQKMTAADSFSAEFVSKSMLKLTVDDDVCLVHLFAAEEGGQI